MNENLRNLFIGIGLNIVFFVIGFAVSHVFDWWKWKKRLEAIESTVREDEIAVCVRVGGNSQPISDVRKFLVEKRPDIKNLLVYSVSAEDAKDKLGEAKTAQRIIEDVFEGIRSYGEGQLTRLHFFPVGMIAYAPLTMAAVSNWCPVVIYHYTNGTYQPIYEVSKESKNQTKRKFQPMKTWEVLKIEPKNI